MSTDALYEEVTELRAENAALRRALAACLESINSYFGLADFEMSAAIDEAIADPENWSPYRNTK